MASLLKKISLFGLILCVSVTVFASSDFDVTPTDLSFRVYEGDPNPDPVGITMTNRREESVNWQVSDANALPISLPDWLSLSATSGTLDPNGLPNSQQEIHLSVDTSGLVGGEYATDFYLTAFGTYISGQKISVDLAVTGPALKISSGSLSFSADEGASNPDAQTFKIINTGGGLLEWTIDTTEMPNWLSIVPQSGSLAKNQEDTITVSVDITGVPAGDYQYQLNVVSPETQNSPQTVTVELKVIGPELHVEKTSFAFSATEGWANPESQTLSVKNGGSGLLGWFADLSDIPVWLTVSQNSGSLLKDQTDHIILSVDITNLPAGNYSYSFTLDAPDSTSNPVTIDIHLSVGFEKYDWSTNPGSGDPNDPYQISTPQQLMSIGSDEMLLTKHYILTNDIIFDPNNNQFHVFEGALIAPFIGRNRTEFTGTFDGKGYRISNFTINVYYSSKTGLFGKISSNGKVANLKLHNAKIFCNRGSRLGGLAGNSEGEISNCCVVGEISGMNEISGYNYVGGLIGENSGIIKDCKTNVRVVGNSGVGGLAGINTGEIAHCYASGFVKGSGGLVGFNDGLIENSHSDATVLGESFSGGLVGTTGDNCLIINCSAKGDVIGGGYLGGLVGGNVTGVIKSSWAAGSVTGYHRLGGLIGVNHGKVSECFATGAVKMVSGYSSNNGFGGLIAFNRGILNNCYATGSVEGSRAAGGCIGWMADGGTLVNCYSSGTVTGTEDVGGLVGGFWDIDPPDPNLFLSCYYLDIAGAHNGSGIPLLDAMMKQQTSFVGWDFDPNDGNPAVWKTAFNNYPVLAFEQLTGIVPDVVGMTEKEAVDKLDASGIRWEVKRVYSNASDKRVLEQDTPADIQISSTRKVTLTVSCFIHGDGSESNPYQIETARQLKLIGLNSNLADKHYVLVRNIVLDPNKKEQVFATSVIGAVHYVGYHYGPRLLGEPFSGTFDGQGYRIENLHIKASGNNYIGLFGYIQAANPNVPSVKNFILEFPKIENAGSNAGCLVGMISNSWIDSCAVKSGSVTGFSDVGGFVGEKNGTITNCYSTAEVYGFYRVGGFVGDNSGGQFYNCYSSGNVTCYRDGEYGAYWGGFAGYGKIMFNSCYFLETAGQHFYRGTPFSDAMMKQQVSFVGWDFMGETANGTDDIWWIDEGNDYPRLWFELNTPPVADAGVDQVIYAFVDRYAEIQLDGTESYDDDGDALEYYWYSDSNELIATGAEPNVLFGVGEYEVTLIVNDGIEDSQPDTCMVTVVDPFEALTDDIIELVQHKGIANSLLAKLDSARKKLEDGNENNHGAAVGSLGAFIHAVNAQRGKKISEEDADYLITVAGQIVNML